MKDQVKATLLAAAGAAMLVAGMTACDKKQPPAEEPKKEVMAPAEAAKTEAAAPAEAAKKGAAASDKPKDHPAH